MRKAFAFFVLLLSLSSFGADDLSSLQRRVEALAIGEATLAYRLIALTASLSIANATDADALVGLLENVDNTLSNGRDFLNSQSIKGGSFSKEISGLLTEMLSCSKAVREYTRDKSYEKLQKTRGCLDVLEEKIGSLTDRFNSTPAPATKPAVAPETPKKK